MESAPYIEVWYGDHQRFGHHGLPQRWVNVLGRVYGSVQKLSYSLNGAAPRELSIGPDARRLAGMGDFNIDINAARLVNGRNVIDILCLGINRQEVSKQVVVDFMLSECPLPYTIHWDKTERISDVAQVVDGLWAIQDGCISPVEIGYDRLIAIGDMRWKDYEVTVPITVHGINAACYQYPSVHAGIGVVMRWTGHTDWGKDEWASGQPWYGPSPYGAIGWYCVFHETGPELNFFDPEFKRPVRLLRRLKLHCPYTFKARVATLANGNSEYSLKVWEHSASEPLAWDLTTLGAPASLPEGAVLLVAHHVAGSFGNVTVQPL